MGVRHGAVNSAKKDHRKNKELPAKVEATQSATAPQRDRLSRKLGPSEVAVIRQLRKRKATEILQEQDLNVEDATRKPRSPSVAEEPQTPPRKSSVKKNDRKDELFTREAEEVPANGLNGTESIESKAPKNSFSKVAIKLTPVLAEKFRGPPNVKGMTSIGALVENFKEKCPQIKVGNLNDITYQVDFIRKHREVAGKFEFLVRWKGWSAAADTWEPERNVREGASAGMCLHICEYFLGRNNKKAFEYFDYYAQKALLDTRTPDYLVLSKMADAALQLNGDCTMVPTIRETEQMQKTVRAHLKQKNFKMLLKNFSSRLISLIEFVKLRTEALDDNEVWSGIIAKKEPGADIDIENLVDSEKLPSNFVYVTDYVVSKKVKVIPPLKHCRCKDEACLEDGCCGLYTNGAGQSYRGYSSSKHLKRACTSVALYECNSKCSCGPNCENRLIQKGVQHELTIFKTLTRGWGVKTRTRINKGAFLGEYLGELMTSKEAVPRHAVNFAYLFDLMPFEGQASENTVDAAKYGNVTRFFNHSCRPNMSISYAYIENHNPAAPRLAFFARRDIMKDEELTFNYRMRPTEGNGTLPRMPCRCEAPGCKKFLF